MFCIPQTGQVWIILPNMALVVSHCYLCLTCKTSLSSIWGPFWTARRVCVHVVLTHPFRSLCSNKLVSSETQPHPQNSRKWLRHSGVPLKWGGSKNCGSDVFMLLMLLWWYNHIKVLNNFKMFSIIEIMNCICISNLLSYCSITVRSCANVAFKLYTFSIFHQCFSVTSVDFTLVWYRMTYL